MAIKVERFPEAYDVHYRHVFGFWDRCRDLNAESDMLNEMLEWCRDQFGLEANHGIGDAPTQGGWRWVYDRPYFVFLFSDAVQAAAYRVRWC